MLSIDLSKQVKNAKIRGVRFTVLTSDQIRKSSACKVIHTTICDKSLPKIGGPNDHRMGTVDRRMLCGLPECEQNVDNCLGHDGHIELHFPAILPGFLPVVPKLLRLTCYWQSHLMLDVKDEDTIRRVKDSHAHDQGRNLFNDIAAAVKTHKVCPMCQGPQPTYIRNGVRIERKWPKDIVFANEEEKAVAERPFTTKTIQQIFAAITRENCEKLGWYVGDMDPEYQPDKSQPTQAPPCKKRKRDVVAEAVHKEPIDIPTHVDECREPEGVAGSFQRMSTTIDVSDVAAVQSINDIKGHIPDATYRKIKAVQRLQNKLVIRSTETSGATDGVAPMEIDGQDPAPMVPTTAVPTTATTSVIESPTSPESGAVVAVVAGDPGDDVQLITALNWGSHPSSMVIDVLDVPPPVIRQTVLYSESGSARGQDDLTHRIQDIIKANDKLGELIEVEAAAKPGKEKDDLFEKVLDAALTVQSWIAIHMNNESSAMKVASSQRVLQQKSVRQRIVGKSFCFFVCVQCTWLQGVAHVI